MSARMPQSRVDGKSDDLARSDADVELGLDPFPTDALPEELADLTRALAESMQIDERAIALPGLAVLASAVGSTANLRLKSDWVVPAIIWVGTVAPPGYGKTPSLRRVLTPVQALERERVDAHRAACSSARERDDGSTPHLESVVVSDTTIEALFSRLIDCPRGLLSIQDELLAFFGGFDRFNSGKRVEESRYNSLWSGCEVSIDRKLDGPIRLFEPRLSLVGNLTPAGIRQLASSHTGTGFAARFLLAWMPPRASRRWVDEEEAGTACANRWDSFVRSSYATGSEGESLLVELSNEARDVWIEFYERNGEAINGLAEDDPLRAAFSKLDDQAARIALVLHRAEPCASPALLSAQVLGRAVRIADWSAREAGRIQARLSAEPPLERLEFRVMEELRRQSNSHSLRGIYRALGVSKDEGERAAKALEAKGLVALGFRQTSTKGGRSTRWVTTPGLAPGMAVPLDVGSAQMEEL